MICQMSGKCFPRLEEKMKKYVLVNSEVNLRTGRNYTAPNQGHLEQKEVKNGLHRRPAVPF